MITVIFKIENAVFQFDQKDVKVRLEGLAYEYGVDEVETILECISTHSGQTKCIHVKNDYFAYIALELIGAGKGSVICEICGKLYEVTQLKSYNVGFGKNPFDVNSGTKGGLKVLLAKKKNMSLFGGQNFKCPAGHVLISLVTWRT